MSFIKKMQKFPYPHGTESMCFGLRLLRRPSIWGVHPSFTVRLSFYHMSRCRDHLTCAFSCVFLVELCVLFAAWLSFASCLIIGCIRSNLAILCIIICRCFFMRFCLLVCRSISLLLYFMYENCLLLRSILRF